MKNEKGREHRQLICGVLASISSAIIWGQYPVCSRFLMLREPGAPSAASILTVAASCNVVIVGSWQVFRLYFQKAQTDETCQDSSQHLEQSDSNQTRRKYLVALLYGLLCLARMLTNMQSCRLTKAYFVSTTAMSLPFFTAFLARIILNETVHWSLMPSLLVMLVGAALLLYGQGAFAEEANSGETSAFSSRDCAGIFLQFISVVFSACLKV